MKAVFWDYDGTIIDTRMKNYHVTKNIIQDVTDGRANEFPLLQSFENYKKGIINITNWRDIYQGQFGFDEETTDRIGRLWTGYQAADMTEAPLFPGIELVIQRFGDMPQAIISQNASGNIRKEMAGHDLERFFSEIVGFEEVDIRMQKPHPGGVFACIERMRLDDLRTLFYIGDHESDAQLVKNARMQLISANSGLTIKSIAVCYDHDQDPLNWQYQPDYIVSHAEEIINIVESNG